MRFPAVMKRLNQNILKEVEERMPKLLKTIEFPKRIHYLTGRLPEANYCILQTKQIDKIQFVNTLAHNYATTKVDTNNYPGLGRKKHGDKEGNRLPSIKQTSKK